MHHIREQNNNNNNNNNDNDNDNNIPGKHEVKELQKTPYWALHTYFGKY